jgi:hypothetical protein
MRVRTIKPRRRKWRESALIFFAAAFSGWLMDYKGAGFARRFCNRSSNFYFGKHKL